MVVGYLQGQRVAKRIWTGCAVLLLIGVCVCMLVNYIIERAITWSLYPVGASVLALGIITAFIFGGKHKLILADAVLALLIMPFLILMQHLSPADAWVWSVGFPIAAVSMLALLVITILFRYTHINRWYCASVAVLSAVPINLTAMHVVSLYLNESKGLLQQLYDVTNTVGICALAFYFVVLGRRKNRAQKK